MMRRVDELKKNGKKKNKIKVSAEQKQDKETKGRGKETKNRTKKKQFHPVESIWENKRVNLN